ncbi:ABC transporter permease [Klenkia sp. LSe6-5]|uniref:ABC transporter permease n=1 Tax=Klenkia sesuvii TaxID=3103137 RepID=A0ABU8DS63_9ACTN
MSILGSILAWFGDASNWSGPNGIPTRIAEHVGYSALAMLIAAAIAVPLGLVLGHLHRGEVVVLSLANAIRALPTLGLLTLVVILSGIGLLPPLIALVVMAVPPMLVNSFESVRNVDPLLVDGARGMGLTSRQVLWRVEVPASLPLILLGVRLAAIQVVSAATIAAYVGLGGLGRYIFDGLSLRQYDTVAGGAVLAALLAIFTEALLLGISSSVVSPGVARRPRPFQALGNRARRTTEPREVRR